MLGSLLLFAILATLSPGGATTLATASGAQFGFLRSIPLILGIAAALAFLIAGSAAGLSSLLTRLPQLTVALKLAGSSYLLWLAVQIGRAGAPKGGQGSDIAPLSFSRGALLLAVNPKAWAMAFGVSASFTPLSSNPIYVSVLMAIVFGGAAVISLSMWCVGGAILARSVRTQRQWQALNVALAVLLGLSILQIWL